MRPRSYDENLAEVEIATVKAMRAIAARDEAIRKAHAAGHSYRDLSWATALDGDTCAEIVRKGK